MTDRYECGIEVDCHGHHACGDELTDATGAYFKIGDPAVATVDELAAHYRERQAAAVVFTIDAQTATGHPPNSVEDLVAGAARNNDVLIPFGSVDPLQVDRAVGRVHEQIALGLRGFNFHPSV